MISTANKEQLPIKFQFFIKFMTDKPELTDTKFYYGAKKWIFIIPYLS